MDSFQIVVNGKVFDLWETAQLDRTIDENAGKFQFTSSNVTPQNYPIRAGDSVQILINDTPKLTGFCEVLESSTTEGVDRITVSGIDNTCDVIASSMPDSVKNIQGPLSMVGLVSKVVEALGANIGVRINVASLPEFNELDFFGADAGKNCMEFLTDFARKRQVYLVSDGKGNIVIFRPVELLLPGGIIHKRNNSENNVISASVLFDHSQRYGKYSSRSQDNFGADPNASYEFGVDRKGESVDPQIRTSRFLEVQGEESFTEVEAVDRSIEELNIRKARSTAYNAIVNGVERSNGVLWDFGQLTKIEDDIQDIKGVFMTRSVSYNSDRRSGTRTEIVFAPPEAYNVRIPTQGDKRRAVEGDKLQTQTPPKIIRFGR